ncbi:MAG TPA: hypothetical protein VHZ04_03770 [Candidatus Paceibacterota bacterium]|jgi:hypothetical protein|nr:hypothetical protein [Candidatus Paceibacterota bacterium]
MKRSLYIIIGIVVLILIVAVVFWFVRGQSSPAATTTTGAGSLPSTGTQGSSTGGNIGGSLPATGVTEGNGSGTSFGLVSNEPALSYFVDPQNDVDVVEPNGEVAEIANGQNGQANFLSSSQIQSLITAGFSYDGAKAFVNFGVPANPQTSVFDMTAKAWTPLAAGIVSPVWSPADYRIAYLATNANGSVTLTTLDISKAGNKPVALVTLAAQDLTLAWPTKNVIVLTDRPSAYSLGTMWFYNLSTKALTPAATPAYGLVAAWSATTKPVAVMWGSGASGRGGGFSLVGALGTSTQTTAQSLNFLTLPSKCTFNTETEPVATPTPSVATTTPKATPTPAPQTYLALYCAVPANQSALSSVPMPDTYDQMSLFTSDNFYRIHTDTGVTDAVLLPTGSYDATDLHVFNNILFFVNRYDQKLYAISL